MIGSLLSNSAINWINSVAKIELLDASMTKSVGEVG